MTQAKIRSFADIPNVITMDLPPMEQIVPALGIARNTIVLWTGADGDGKTFLVQAMAIAVARGSEFLSMPCQKTPVLYVDLENPAYMVQSRLRPMVADEQIQDLRIWGIWCDQQPPQAGSELLLTIAKETRPLIIVDPFRYFHGAEENDSTAMSGIMQYLRACAAYGAAVILLHHPAKTEGSTGRGSSVIRGACDLAFLHSLDKESGLITLKVDKNRHGESRTIIIRADFEDGLFDVTEAPYITRRKDELAKIQEIITSQPGITQNGIAKVCGIRKGRLGKLMEEGCGTLWNVQLGSNRSKLFYPPSGGSVAREPLGTSGTTGKSGGVVVPVVRRLIGGTTVPPTDPGKTLPSCKNCGSFALYRDGSCMTCE
jgi:archaellum biogenesis ATPase FlaH